MAVFSKSGLITELLDRIELIKASTQPFLRLTDDQLNSRPRPGAWSIAETFCHLNISHDTYIRNILSRITMAPDIHTENYKSGWLGDLVYGKIMPRADGSVFKMRAPKSLAAGAVPLDGRETVQQFLHQCDSLDDILRHAATKDLQRIRIPVPFSKFIYLRLGDNFRCLVAHSERHLLQAHRTMTSLS